MPLWVNDSVLQGMVVLLAAGGLANATYFTLAYYGRVRKARWVPAVLCAREGSSCVTVVQTPYARVLGVPNSLLGILYYTLLTAWVLFGSPDWHIGVRSVLFSLSAFLVTVSFATVVLGFYLVYALRRRLGVDCPLCYTAHAINSVLFVLVILLTLR